MILFDKTLLFECDGGGDCGGGDCCTAGVPGSAACGCDHGHGDGFMGTGCFHVPFPVAPVYYTRFGGYSQPYRKTKNGKKKKYKNPYVAGMKIIQEDERISYSGRALRMFDKITEGVDPISVGTLYPNTRLGFAWKLDENGEALLYKPVPAGPSWTICEMALDASGKLQGRNAYGKYRTCSEAMYDVHCEVCRHERALSESRIDMRGYMKHLAKGGDPFDYKPAKPNVNVEHLNRELRRRFNNQFNSVELSDKKAPGGEWTLEFKLPLPDGKREIRGTSRVMYVVPQLRNILTFLKSRRVEINP